MSAGYENAKRVALGLVREQAEQAGDDLWGISLGVGAPLQAEMPYSFFGKAFEAPEEQQAQKAALMLYEDEYEADRKAAEKHRDALEKALRNNDVEGLKKLLDRAPAAEWLSLIFLDGESIEKELVPAMEKAGTGCRTVFAEALGQAIDTLEDFKGLLEELKSRC